MDDKKQILGLGNTKTNGLLAVHFFCIEV